MQTGSKQKKKLQYKTSTPYLKIKSVAVVTAREAFVQNSKVKDYETVFIHGLEIYDMPYKEVYLVSAQEEISEFDRKTRPKLFKQIERKNLLSFSEVRRIIADKKVFTIINKRTALLASYDELRPDKSK